MKLRNKKTGEIVEFRYLQSDYVAPLVRTTYENDKPEMYTYNSLAELNEEWEDYEEPKEYWFINDLDGTPMKCELRSCVRDFTEWREKRKEIGNYFDTREEAEKAVEKLKAWKRLGNKGFRFTGYDTNYGHHRASFVFEKEAWATETEPDLDLLFGGEE